MEKKLNQKLNISYEDAIQKLNTIASSLEKGEIPLQKAVELYEEGVALRECAQNHLKQAQMRLESINEDPKITQFFNEFEQAVQNLRNSYINSIALKEQLSEQSLNIFYNQLKSLILNINAIY